MSRKMYYILKHFKRLLLAGCQGPLIVQIAFYFIIIGIPVIGIISNVIEFYLNWVKTGVI